MTLFTVPESEQESLIKPRDINASRLAQELKIETYRLPDTYPTQARELLRDMYQNFGKKTLNIPSESLGDFLEQNKDEIMSHFYKYPDMWRWPLALLEEDVDNEITLPLIQGATFRNMPEDFVFNENIAKNIAECPIPTDASDEEIGNMVALALDNTIVILCFATFIMRCEQFATITQKYTGKILDKDETISLIADEGRYELETVWGSRYVSVITRILGNERASRYRNLAQKNTLEVLDRNFYERSRAQYWRQKLPYERVLVENPGSQENATRDLEGFNFFLCQNHIYGYTPLVVGMATNSQAHHDNWTVWIKKYIDKIVDKKSETHKVCKYVFQITGDIFVDGHLSEEAQMQIPSHLHGVFETALKKHLKRHAQQPRIAPAVDAIITQKSPEIQPKITLTGIEWRRDINTLTFAQGVPPDTYKVEVRIYKNTKVVGFGIHEGTDISTLCLTKDRFQNQTISAEKSLLLGQEFSYTPGEKYFIGIIGQTPRGKTEEFRTESFMIPKEKKEQPISSQTFSHAPRVQGKINTIIANPVPTSHNTKQPTPPTTPSKNPQESEKEDLQTAIDLFLDKTDKELQRFFEENSLWNEETQSLTLSIPIAELEEMGYEPTLLSVEEYGPLLQWTAKKKNTQWHPHNGEKIPQKILTQFDTIFLTLSHKNQRTTIDDTLSSLGFPPSDTDNNERLRAAIRIEENIDIKKLLAGINEISDTYTERGMPFNVYHKPGKNVKIPQSISLLSKGHWIATLSLEPTVEIKITTIKGSPLPYDTKIFSQRVENALLNFVYQYIKNGKGISGIITRTTLQEDTKKLRESYRRDLKNNTARLLVENPDGITFSIIGNISLKRLQQVIKEAQTMYGPEKVALLYRKSTYAFVGDTSICRPSQYRSDEDYTSLNIPERRQILRERIIKTLFNGKSGILDRAPFLYGSAVYHALQFEVQAFQDKVGRDITPEDISDTFIDEFVDILRSREVLISYRDYCAGWVEDLTNLYEE